jgi:hypothetical protein
VPDLTPAEAEATARVVGARSVPGSRLVVTPVRNRGSLRVGHIAVADR